MNELLRFSQINYGLYTRNNFCHDYNTKNCNYLRIPEHRMTLNENVVYYASIKYFFNQLPAEVREERRTLNLVLGLRSY